MTKWPRARRCLTSWYQDGRLPGTSVPHREPSWQHGSRIWRLAGVSHRGIVASRQLTSHIGHGTCRLFDVFCVTKRSESIANSRVSWHCGCVAARCQKSWISVILGDPPSSGKLHHVEQMASRAEVSYILAPGWQAVPCCTSHRAILAAW